MQPNRRGNRISSVTGASGWNAVPGAVVAWLFCPFSTPRQQKINVKTKTIAGRDGRFHPYLRGE